MLLLISNEEIQASQQPHIQNMLKVTKNYREIADISFHIQINTVQRGRKKGIEINTIHNKMDGWLMDSQFQVFNINNIHILMYLTDMCHEV